MVCVVFMIDHFSWGFVTGGFLEPSWPIGQEPISCFLSVRRLDVREDIGTQGTSPNPTRHAECQAERHRVPLFNSLWSDRTGNRTPVSRFPGGHSTTSPQLRCS